MSRNACLLLVVLGGVLLRAMLIVLVVPHRVDVVDALCHYDCGWYERIALSGYLADADWDNLGSAPHWAFFPLYPMCMRALVWLSGMGAQKAGLVISLAAAGAMALLIGRAVARRHGRGGARAALFVLAFPMGVFFSLVYAEALYGALSAASLGALRARRPMRAALCAAAAGATRPAGILLAPIIATDRLRALWRLKTWSARAIGDALLPIAVAPLGLSAYVLAQYLATGDGFAFAHVQVLWQRSWANPLARIWNGLASLDLFALFGGPSLMWHALWAAGGIGLGLALLYRRRVADGVFLVGSVLLPAATGLDAIPRFVGTNPVFLQALGGWLVWLPGWLTALILVTCTAAQAWLLHVWIGGGGGLF